MATIRLVPSIFYNQAGTSYLTVSNQNNALTNTDSTTYATVDNTYASTTNRYIYLQGFNFDDIPANAVINSFSIKLKANESGGSTSSSYRPVLCKGTATYSNAYCNAITTSTTVHEFEFTQDFATFRDDGDEFGIRINCRRGSRNTAASFYIYGAEIEVDYTVPNPRTVTSSLNGDGTISPDGVTNTFEGAEYTLTITPTNQDDPVTVTRNGTDVTDQVVAHGTGGSTSSAPDNVTTSGIQSGSSYAEYAVGHTAESPSSSGTSSNMYASSSSTGYAAYSFDFSAIPSNATIEGIEVRCYGHRESSTISSTYVSQCVLYSGSTAISDEVDFPSTSNSIITLTPTTLPTRAQLDDVVVRHYVGYYGGLVLGITFEVTYSTGTGIDHYTYSFTVTGDAVLAVTIGNVQTDALYVKFGASTELTSTSFSDVSGSLPWDLSMLETGSSYHISGYVMAYAARVGYSSFDDDFVWNPPVTIDKEAFGITLNTSSISFDSHVESAPYGSLTISMASRWHKAIKAFKKINGSWVEQTDLTNVFQNGINYVKGVV